jgi:hypothetical protein
VLTHCSGRIVACHELAKARDCYKMLELLRQNMKSGALSIASIAFDDGAKKQLVEILGLGSKATP